MAKGKKGSSGKSDKGGKKKKPPVEPVVEPTSGPKVEVHLAYLSRVLTEGTLYHVARKTTNLEVAVTLLMVKAVIRDLRVAAKVLGTEHVEALDKISMPYLNSVAKAGEGGNSDPELLQGP